VGAGGRPKGWLSSGLPERWPTLDYLVEAGATYVADGIDDDQPYLMHVGGKRLCSLPSSGAINDLPQMLRAGRSSDECAGMIRRQCDTLYREGAQSGRVMAICLHPYAGSGVFKGVPGTTRLAGTIDMRQFRERNEIAFDDISLIKLADRQKALMDSQARIRQAQRQLQEAGFAPGSLDGVLGPQTRVALQQYQAKRGLPKTGELDEATRKALGIY
jgi:hypothetical protein